MITTENLEKLLARSITINEISAQELKNFGFNYNDIHALMEKNKLKRLKRGVYSWTSSSELYSYGKELIKDRKYQEARACFETCYQINPEDVDIQFQLFYKAIYDKNYEKAIEYYDFLVEHISNREDLLDLNVCLILMSVHGELSEQSKAKIASFTYADILKNPIIDERNDLKNQNLLVEDKYRKYIMLQQYDSAYSIMAAIERHHSLSPYQHLVKLLLNKVLILRNKMTLDLAQNKEYDKLVMHLEMLVNRNLLDEEMHCALELTRQILEIETTGKIPNSTFSSTQNIYTAIANKEYRRALFLYSDYKEKGKRTLNQAIYVLLENLIELIDAKKLEEPTKGNIVILFKKQDFNATLRHAHAYLEKVGKMDYEFLINELVFIAQLRNQTNGVPLEATLTALENNEIDVSTYAFACYEALAIKNYLVVNHYIKILLGLKTLGHSYPLLNQLIEMYNALEKGIKPNENFNVGRKEDKIILEDLSHESEKDVYSQPIDEKPVRTFGKRNVQENRTADTDKVMLQAKYEQILEKGGIILLKTMPWERRKRIYSLIRESFPGMRGFGIGKGPETKRLLLKPQAYGGDFIDVKALINEGNIAYQKRQFTKCINCYQNALKYIGNPTWKFYSKLGLAYMRAHHRQQAILYLTIAEEKLREEGIYYCSYIELIEYLKGNKEMLENKKPQVKFSLNEFKNNLNEYYGLEAIEEMAAFVSNGKTIEEVQEKFSLTEEQVALLMLIFARNCYANGDFTLGDQYLRKVEKRKNKTEQIKQLLEEIRRKKKFYRNQVSEEVKPFLLTK